MLYATQGTVQAAVKTNGEVDITINPLQDYIVRRGGEDFIVFVTDDPKAQPLAAKVFKKTQIFTVRANSILAQRLVDAALKGIKIEIKIEIESETQAKTKPNIDLPIIPVDSIRIPATLDKA